jgi:hypothetical protein
MITETGITAWLLSKLAPTLAALFGGLSLVLLWTPQRLLEKGKIVSIFLAGAIAAASGFSLTGIIIYYLGIDPAQLDIVVGIAWTIGFFSIALFNLAANFFANRQNKDILEVYEEVQTSRQRIKKPEGKRG